MQSHNLFLLNISLVFSKNTINKQIVKYINYNEFITKQGLSAATAAACPFDTYTNLYISALVPNAATLVDGLVEFDYQKS